MDFLRKAILREEDPQKKLPEAIKTLTNLEQGGAIISFKQADNNVKDIADFGFASLTTTSKDERIAIVAQRLIKKAMDKAAKQLPKEAFKQFRIAKRFSQMEHNIFSRTVIKKMLKDTKDFTPESVWNMVKNAGPQNIKLIRELMQPSRLVKANLEKAAGRRPVDTSVNEKTFWRNVQGRFLSDMMKTAEGDIKQKTIINKIEDAILSGRFKEMFPGPRGKLAAESFKRFATAKNIVLTPNPTGRGGLMVKVGQPSALIAAGGGVITAAAGQPEVGGGIVAGGIGVFLLPEALALLVTRRGLSRWLINQSQIGPVAAKGTQAILSFANVLKRENIDFEFFNEDANVEIPNVRRN